MILKRKNFTYPTKEEVDIVYKTLPKLECFGFNFNETITIWGDEKLSLEQITRIDNLKYWDICLSNKLSKTRSSYEYLIVHFNRGVCEDLKSDDELTIINTAQFEYYAEVFYYFYFSSLDILAQIVSLYFDPLADENRTAFNCVFSKKHTFSDNLLFSTYQKLNKARDYRHAFTHRFTPLLNDSRSRIIVSGEKKYLGIGVEQKLDYQDAIDNSSEALNILSDLLKEIKAFMVNDTENNKYLFEDI
ncbi:MAG: Cthe_2314 family HEPN domain-containing protein [Bacteroidia bacterium]|nr:Cthe_2314 family HEPN domain-containing protein [Bacteroidia bacterium]